jgi:SAM-dependent methyltransferase
MESNWFNSLVCPMDRAALTHDDGALHCTGCGRSYPLVDGIPNFRRDVPLAGSTAWTAAQQYELAYWTGGAQQELASAREARLRRAAAELAQRFDQTAPPGWRHRVLHVGPAAAGEVNFLDAAERYAAEPLACLLDARGLLHRDGVRWVAAKGEHLPFPDAFFSMALLPNVIDHVADPERLLAELRRCLMPTGRLWLSCHVSSALVNPLFRALHRLRIGYFAGHLWFYSAAGLDRLCTRAGFHAAWTRTEPLDEAPAISGGTLRWRLKRHLLSARYLLLAPEPTAADAPHGCAPERMPEGPPLPEPSLHAPTQ